MYSKDKKKLPKKKQKPTTTNTLLRGCIIFLRHDSRRLVKKYKRENI